MDRPRTTRSARRRLPALLRFGLLGALLFAVFGADGPQARRVDLSSWSDEAVLLEAALARDLAARDPVARRRLVQNMRFAGGDLERDEAALVREAHELGMHRSDPVVRRRLVQRLRLEAAARARATPPSEEVLQAYLDRHAERFTEPARRQLLQVPFRDEPRARDALARLDPGSAEPLPSGDPLPMARALPSSSAEELGRQLGPAFARRAFSLPETRWSGPVRSPYGWHLVFVVSAEPERRSPLATVRAEVREALLAERADRAVAAEVARLRREGPW